MSEDERSTRRGYIVSPWAILFILAFINFLNYVDRLVIGGLVPILQQPVADGGLGLSGTQTGLLQSAFMWVHSVASIPLGIVADRYMRKKLIALGVGVWSVATALAGFAQNFGQLIVSRASVGIGEATYAPAATSLISDSFSAKSRARAMGVFQAGMAFGGGVGIVVGAAVGDAWGWRAAFFMVGVPGLLLTAAALAIAERPRPPLDPELAAKKMTREIRLVLRSKGVLWIYAAGVLITFMVGALVFWGTEFVVRYHYAGDAGAADTVAVTFGPIVIFSSVVGAIVGSMLADRLETRVPGRGRLLVVALGPLLGMPFVVVGLWTGNLVLLYVSLGIGSMLNSFYLGPVLAALHDCVGQAAQATSTGFYFFIVHFLGDAISPPVVGIVSDATESLRVGMTVAAAAAVLGGLAALAGLRSVEESVKSHRAPTPG